MKKKKVLIIGAGIAGLAAGSYLERNGYDTEIFEAHSQPGGLCTAWERGDYTFDYCIHWLLGTNEKSDFHTIWEELGALEDEEGNPIPIRNFDEFTRIELSDGDVVRLYADADRLQEELLRVAPEDEKKIRKFIKDMKRLSGFEMMVITEKRGLLKKIWFGIKNISAFLKMIKYVRMSLDDLAQRWESPVLRQVFNYIDTPVPWSAAALVLGLSKQHVQAAGYPVGGSLTFSRNIERRYLELGGEINYNSQVEKILVRDDQATGIRLGNGEEYFGDEVVSAADGYSTLFEMLEGEYLSPKLEKTYEEYPRFPSSIFIGLGVDKELDDFPHSMMVNLDQPLELPDGTRRGYFDLNIYNFDPTLAPEGKTPVTVLINTWEDTYWRKLAEENPDAYREAKSRVGEQVLEILEERFPGFRSAVEVMDISTPHTVKRYTNNWHGSYEGFAPTPETLMSNLPKEVPGLDNCYMIGQWTQPGGGIPPAALDGRNLARKFCRRDGKEFRGQV